MSSQRNTINLLDVEPDLGEGLNPQERAAAARVLAVPSHALEPGPWEPERDLGEIYPVVGFLIVDGMVTRDLLFAGRTTTELLGAGDILRPWDDDVAFDALPFSASWNVQTPARVAMLDTRVAIAAGRWPSLASALHAPNWAEQDWLTHGPHVPPVRQGDDPGGVEADEIGDLVGDEVVQTGRVGAGRALCAGFGVDRAGWHDRDTDREQRDGEHACSAPAHRRRINDAASFG